MGKTDYQARGVLYLPDEARFAKLLNLPKEANVEARELEERIAENVETLLAGGRE